MTIPADAIFFTDWGDFITDALESVHTAEGREDFFREMKREMEHYRRVWGSRPTNPPLESSGAMSPDMANGKQQMIEDTELAIARIHPGSSPDDVATAINQLDVLGDRVKAAKEMLKDHLTEYVRANGSLEIGTMRYYLGRKKITKCVNVPDTLAALLGAVAGDWNRMCEFLSAGPVKHGAARQVLAPDDYALLFISVDEDELKEGKPEGKTLQKTDTRFIR